MLHLYNCTFTTTVPVAETWFEYRLLFTLYLTPACCRLLWCSSLLTRTIVEVIASSGCNKCNITKWWYYIFRITFQSIGQCLCFRWSHHSYTTCTCSNAVEQQSGGNSSGSSSTIGMKKIDPVRSSQSCSCLIGVS